MPYTVRSSERTRGAGAEYETKALLYLMNFSHHRDEIHFFVVDFFNDLTGMDRYSDKLWDLQSKGAKNNSPMAIGRELVTLFNNYLSDFEFKEYILFLGGVSTSVRKDELLDVFSISNVNDAALKKIKKGLQEEAKEKTYINKDAIADNIDEFLGKVLFVIDNKPKSEYVKAIIKDHPAIIPEEAILNAIFNEIRDKQAGLKNTNVNGVVIQTPADVLMRCRHLTNSEIRLMTLSRVINRNPVEKKAIPPSFADIYSGWPPERRSENLDQCVQALCRALFNKNAATAFWNLFENIYSLIVNHPTYTTNEIYQALDIQIRDAEPDFDAVTLKYFIATVKDGVQNDH